MNGVAGDTAAILAQGARATMAPAGNPAWLQAYHGIFPALWNCRLAEIKKWLGVDEPRRAGRRDGDGAGAAPGGRAQPRGRARLAPIPKPDAYGEWLALLNMVPLQAPQGPGKGATPIAVYRAVLKYAEDQRFLAGLAGAESAVIEGLVGGSPDGWKSTLYDLLAATPGGAEVLLRVVAATGREPAEHGRSTWWRKTGDPFYDHYIPKALRHATLADAKRLLRAVGFPAAAGDPPSPRSPWLYRRGAPHARWVEAACSSRHLALFEYALQRFGPSTRDHGSEPEKPLAPHEWWGFLVAAGHPPRDLEPRLALLLREGQEDLGQLLALARPLGPPPFLYPERKVQAGCDPRDAPDGGVLLYALVLLIGPERARHKRRALLRKEWWEAIPPAAKWQAGPPFGGPSGDNRAWRLHYGAFPYTEGPHAALEGLADLLREKAFLAAPAEAQERGAGYLMWLYAGWVWQPISYLGEEPKRPGVRAWAAALHRRWPRLPLAPIYGGVLEHLFRASHPPDPHRYLLAYLCVAGAGVLRVAAAVLGSLQSPPAGKEVGAAHLAALKRGFARVARAHFLCARGQRRWFAHKGKTRCRALGEELVLLPPQKEGPLAGGGVEVGRLGSTWARRAGRAFGPPPAHCEPEELAWCAVNPGRVVLSAKADGVHYQGEAPQKTVPPIPPEFSGCLLQAERVKRAGGGTLWLIYDIETPDLLDSDLAERMGSFRAALGLPPSLPGPDGCRRDDLGLADHLAAVPEEADVLWPKWNWALPPDHPPAAFLELVAAAPPVGTYPCDGWVCAPRLSLAPTPREVAGCARTLKIKPPAEMTADLSWGGTEWEPPTRRGPLAPPPSGARGVWRCTWGGEGWVPRDHRPEKARPNPDSLVAALERAHLAPWSPRDLIPFIAQRHYATVRPELSASAEAFLRRQRADVRSWLEEEGIARAASVFDAGCGRGSHCHSAPGHWTGVDRSPTEIFDARLRRGGPRATWVWADMAGLVHPFTREPVAELRPGGYDFLVAVHSIHSAAGSVAEWEGWVRALTRLAAPGAVLCLRTVDPLALFEAPAGPPGLASPDVVHLPGGSWFRRVEGGEGPERPSGAVPIRTSLSWAASAGAPRTEWFVPPDTVVSTFVAAGWSQRHASPLRQGGAEVPGWEPWVRAEKSLVFLAPAR